MRNTRIRVILPCLMVFMVMLQIYQVHRLDSSLMIAKETTTLTTSSVDGGRHQHQHQQQQQRDFKSSSNNSRSLTIQTPDGLIRKGQATASEDGESFSACLMIMDDNAHLIEWLAYHYTKLPLRRLIVGVDPRSQTSPTSILQRWSGRIIITEWTELDFMPPNVMDKHLHIDPSDHQALTDLFRQRQEHFYARCMARLKYEGRTWTAFVDTDEYILINQNAMAGFRVIPVEQSHTVSAKRMTVLDGIKLMTSSSSQQQQQGGGKDVNLRSNKEDGSQSATNYPTDGLTYQTYKQTSPCLAMARVAFGVKESEPEQIQQGIPKMFFGSFIPLFSPYDFQTMRWRYHSGRGAKKTNKISKSLLDVSQIESSLFIPHEQVMVHLPSKKYCHTGGTPSHVAGSGERPGSRTVGGLEQHLWVLNAHSPIVVHHYSGTWEQWSHRKDTRGKRTWENYQKMAYDASTDDHIRPWLQEFVDQVGWLTARDLLSGVGQI